MGISSRALYTCLLEDLNDCFPASQGIFTCEDTDGWPGASSIEVAAMRLRQSLLKKFNDDEASDAEQRAFEVWADCNNRCDQWTLNLESSKDEVLWGEFKRSLYQFFNGDHTITWKDIFLASRVGPGSAVGSKSTDMYSKLFSGDLVSSSSLLNLIYKSESILTPLGLEAELSRSQFCGSSIVEGSRLSFVPKSREIRRSICVEPNLNIFFQLGYASFLTDSLYRKFGISLEAQPDKNRELCRLGSIDGSFSTIDLSSASDTIGLRLCQEVLPASVFGRLTQLRCPCTSYKGQTIQLHMMSSMGNGFTFPLQTILFSCMVEAAYRFRNIRFDKPFDGPGSFGVFGDDIVVRREAFEDVTRLIALAGFRVNHKKSFHNGFFRESCGVEFHAGYPTRGVFCKTLKTMQDRYVTINRLNEWSSEHSIPLSRTVKYLVRFCKYTPVPFSSGYDSGIRVPRSLLSNPIKIKRYQSIGYYAYLPISRRVFFENETGLPDALGMSLGFRFNPAGLILCLLAGHLRYGAIGIRSNPVRYHRKLVVSPNWDYKPTVNSSLSCFGRQLWETIVCINLTG
jgi:hypothetical protein